MYDLQEQTSEYGRHTVLNQVHLPTRRNLVSTEKRTFRTSIEAMREAYFFRLTDDAQGFIKSEYKIHSIVKHQTKLKIILDPNPSHSEHIAVVSGLEEITRTLEQLNINAKLKTPTNEDLRFAIQGRFVQAYRQKTSLFGIEILGLNYNF
jgi:hypothetical protein